MTLETNESSLIIKGLHSEFNLPSGNPDEFPTIVGFEENSYFEIPARLFRELVKRTIFATDTETKRYALGGVLFEITGDEITAVGTDGRRLARMQGKGNLRLMGTIHRHDHHRARKGVGFDGAIVFR